MSDGAAITAWRLHELLKAAELAGLCADAESADRNPPINRITVDSRDAGPGACFIALVGTQVDGHRFVQQALDQGVAAVIIEAGRCAFRSDRIIEVASTHEAVARLAATFYGVDQLQRDGKLKLIGVTGTNGKTTVVTLITSILRAGGLAAGSLGTIGFDLGVDAADSSAGGSNMTTLPPIELCAALADAVRADVEYVTMEVSSHALDQRRCDGLDFATGVFTNLTQDHLDYHGDMNHYAAAKRRLFDRLNERSSAVVNADDPFRTFMTRQTSARVLSFGLEAAADIHAENLKLQSDGSTFELHLEGERTVMRSPLIGRHNVSNILSAVAAGRSLGVEPKAIRTGIANVSVIPGRLERVDLPAPYSVFVDYAHTPDALENVLRVLGELTRGRLICVFGGGGNRDKTKRAPMGRAVATLADVGIVTSDNPRHEDPNAIIEDVLAGFETEGQCELIVMPDRGDAIVEALQCAKTDDTVLIAGKGHEDYQIIGDERRSFDDRLVARAAGRQLLEVPA